MLVSDTHRDVKISSFRSVVVKSHNFKSESLRVVNGAILAEINQFKMIARAHFSKLIHQSKATHIIPSIRFCWNTTVKSDTDNFLKYGE